MIDAFLRGLESIFAWLIEASWEASVLVALVLLLHLVLWGRLNPRWHHALWLLVIARLLLPFLPESAFSVFQFAPSPPPVVTETVTEPIFNALPVPTAGTPLLPALPAAYPFSAFTVLALVWIVGALALLILTWQVNRRFARHVVAAPLVTNPRLLKLAETAQQELGLHRRLRIIESAQVQSPAIMGLFRPTLILPKDVRARFEDDELRFIFLHEFAHLKRGDLFLQWLVALLQILHWFNPVLWYAFRRMRADREPATDALVLSCTGEAYKESYGQVLVKLLEHYHQRHSLPTLVGILEDKDQFKRRFSLIAKFTRDAYGWSLLGVLLIAALSAICLTKAKEVAPAAPENANVQVLAIDLPESEYQADRQRIDDIVHNGYFISLLRLPQAREIARSALGKTTFGHGAGLITSPSGPVLMFQITPTRDQDKIKINGSVTFDRQGWSYDSGKVPNLALRPVTTVPIASTLTPQHLQAVPPEGILEPDGVRPPRDNQPHRLFLFFTAWAENDISTSVFSSLAALKTQMPVAPVPLPDPFVRSGASDFQPHDTTVTEKKEDKNEALLREAIADDDYPGAKKLIEAGVQVRDWNIADAMANKHARIVKLLWDHTVDRGSEIRYQISQGATVAQVAAMLKDGAPAEPSEDVFIDPLGVAAANGDLPMIQLLLANGANPNWEGIWQGNKVQRYTALGITVGQRRIDIITYLFDHGQKPSDFGAMIGALYDCTDSYPADQRQISKQIVRLLVARGALDLLPGNRGIYLYIACVKVADPELVKLLLDHGCSPEEVAIDGQGTAPVIQQVRDAVAGKNNKPPRLELQPILALLEVADKGTTPKSDAIVSPPPATKDASLKAYTYLEVSYVETAITSAMPGGMTTTTEAAKPLIQNPKNKHVLLNDFPLQPGMNTLKGKTPWGSDFTVTLNWSNTLANKAQDLSLKMEWLHANGGEVSYGSEFKASLGPDECFVVTGPWKTKETSNLLISFVNHPTEQPQEGEKSSASVSAPSANLINPASMGLPPVPIPNPTPLEKALTRRDTAAIKMLLDQGATVYMPDVYHALSTGQKEAMKLLWDHGGEYCSELAYAISQNRPMAEIEKISLQRPSSNPWQQDVMITPLGIAAQEGNKELVAWLLDHGADPHPFSTLQNPLLPAVQGRHPEIVDYLLKHGAYAGDLVLFTAICWCNQPDPQLHQGSIATVKSLIQAGVLKNETSGMAGQALMTVCEKRNSEVLKLLLDSGMSPRLPNNYPPAPNKPVIDVIREEYVQRATKPEYADLKPLLDLLEAADKSAAKT